MTIDQRKTMPDLDHPFEARNPDAPRCEHLIDGTNLGTALCGQARARHRTTAPANTRAVRQPVHPREFDVYASTTRVGGLDIAVDEAGCLVLHAIQAGAYTITNLDGFVADLELARQHARRFEAHPELYRREPREIEHEADGAEVVLTGVIGSLRREPTFQGREVARGLFRLPYGNVEIEIPPVVLEATMTPILVGERYTVAAKVDRRDDDRGVFLAVSALAVPSTEFPHLDRLAAAGKSDVVPEQGWASEPHDHRYDGDE